MDYVEFLEADGYGFTKDCVLLPNNSFRAFLKTTFEEHVADGRISKKGSVSAQKLAQIWRLIGTARKISEAHMQKILTELRAKNIENLAEIKPAKKRKRYK